MKINLLIDTNNLFYQSTDVTKYAKWIGKTFPKTELKLGSPEALEIFKDKIDTDIKTLLLKFPRCENIFFLRDSSSWRKKVKINGEYSYKKSRKVKNAEIDWNAFEEGIASLIESNKNFKTIRMEGFEADDLVYLVNEKILNECPNSLNIIVSTDSDFKQLLQKRTIIYNPTWRNTRILFSNEFTFDHLELFESSQENDIGLFKVKQKDSLRSLFDVSDIGFNSTTEKKLSSVIKNDFEMEVVDSKIGISEKIIKGDDKDNVPSVFSWKGTNDNIRRVTQKHVDEVFDYFKEENIEIKPKALFENIDIIHKLLETYTKQKMNKDELKNAMKTNYILLVLSRKVFPKHLVEEFDKLWDRNFSTTFNF